MLSRSSVSYKNTQRQFNKIRQTISKQNEKFNREIEIIKKEPNRNSGAKEYRSEMKNAIIENINSRPDPEEEESMSKTDHLPKLSSQRRTKEKE